jgi:vacuolar-type H+-ATPase subunit E/Vma4
MAKAKMIKAVAGKVSKIKDSVSKMLGEVKALKNDITIIKDEAELLKNDIKSGKAMEDGKKCLTAKKANLKECYEHIYEPIKPAAGGGGDGEKGCCVVF